MRNVNFIVVVLELNFKLKGVVVAAALLLHCVLEICYVFAITVPT